MNVAETASLRPVKSLENFRILSASVFLNLRIVCYNHSRISPLLGQLLNGTIVLFFVSVFAEQW